MSIFANIGFKDAKFYPNYNTRFPMDIVTGLFERGFNNQWLLNGGLPPILGLSGRGGYYKSTYLDSIIVSILEAYPESEAYKLDTENNNFTNQRFHVMAKKKDTVDRIHCTNLASQSMSEFEEMIKQIGAYKVEHKKDCLVESPFKDNETGKPLLVWMPTVIGIDSFTCFKSGSEIEKTEKTNADSKDRNMIFLHDGLVKHRLMTMFSQYAYKYGLNFILTAQVDDRYDLEMFKTSVKQNQWMKQGDQIKSVGSQFKFLTNTLLQCLGPTPLTTKDKDKDPWYPINGAGSAEINDLNVKIIRCKTNASGLMIPTLASQNYGIMPGLSYYHFLVEHDDFGFITKGNNKYSVLMPDLLLKRTNINTVLQDNYELNRALEIMGQLKWMLMYWNIKNFGVSIPETAEKFVELVVSNNTTSIQDILNSRGYWTYDKANEHPYMSILDICELITKK